MLIEGIHSFHINESGAPTGGAERYLIALHQELQASGNPAILIYGRNEPGTYLPPDGSTIVEGIDLADEPESSRAGFLQLLKHNKPDLIHFHNLNNTSLISQMSTTQTTVRTVHDSRLFCPMEFRMKNNGELCNEAAGLNCLACMSDFQMDNDESITRLKQTMQEIEATKQVSILVTPSNYIREQLILNQVDDSKIIVIPPFLLNEIDTSSSHMEKETTDVLFVGRIVRSKGLHLLLESLVELPNDTTLTIVGDGPDLNNNIELSRRLKLGNRVSFVGWANSNQLSHYYRRSKVLAVPSMGPEAFGLVGLEAMAEGKPVVAFDSGGINQWLVDGINGYLVSRGNVEDLTDKIGRLINNQDLRNSFGHNGLSMIHETFNRKAHVDRLLTIYQSILT